MSIIGMLVMWLFTASAFYLFSRWHMGKESDRRVAYWKKYEGK